MGINRREDDPISAFDTVEVIQTVGQDLIHQNDLQGMKGLFSHLYAQLVQKLKGQSLEEIEAKQKMEKALQEVLSKPVRERHRYFRDYGSPWWRQNDGDIDKYD